MSSQQSNSPRTQVRKIFKKGDTFLCGICGRSHPSIPEVQACLTECTKTFLVDGKPIEAAPKRYRCGLCKRIHNSLEEAQNCSLECKSQIETRIAEEKRAMAPINLEQKLKALAQFAKDPEALKALKAVKEQHKVQDAPKVLGTFKKKSGELIAGENIKFMRDKNMFRCMRCKQRYSNAEQARSCYDAHSDNFTSFSKPKSSDARYTLDGKKFRCSKCEKLYGLVADVINCYESHQPAVVGRSGKEPDSPVYLRDGAKYVCRKCGKKYFSREEVQLCFESSHENLASSPSADPQPQAKSAVENSVAKAFANKKDDAAMFYRDGAKYVCRGCGKKYFSKDETIACFEADP